MKKKFVIFTLSTIFAIIGLNVAKAQPPCPPGTILYNFVFTFPNSPCTFGVDVCYKCVGASPEGLVTIQKITYLNTDPDCFNINAGKIMTEVWNYVSSPEFYFSLPICEPCKACKPPFLPNSSEWTTITKKIPLCWYIYNDHGILQYLPCPDSPICVTSYNVCYNANTGNYSIWGNVSYTTGGTPTCLYPDPNSPPVIPPTNTGGDCFRIHTACD